MSDYLELNAAFCGDCGSLSAQMRLDPRDEARLLLICGECEAAAGLRKPLLALGGVLRDGRRVRGTRLGGG